MKTEEESIESEIIEFEQRGFSLPASVDRNRLLEYAVPKGTVIVGNDAFNDCISLTKVSIPSGVEEIGWRAFNDCGSLERVRLPESVKSIGGRAFNGCSSLVNVRFPKMMDSIGEGAFSGCESLVRMRLPEGIDKINDSLFDGCLLLKSVNVPNGVKTIGASAFEQCESLAELTVPEGVTELGEDSFKNCRALTRIVLPVGVTRIGEGAFSGCVSLEEVSIPDSVVEIGKDVFYSCGPVIRISENAYERLKDSLPKSVRYEFTSKINTEEVPAATVALNIPEDVEERRLLAAHSASPEVLAFLVKDEDWETRVYVASNPNTPAEVLATLAKDERWEVRETVAGNFHTPVDILRALSLDADSSNVRSSVSFNHSTPEDVLRHLAQEADLRDTVAVNPVTPPDLLAELAADADYQVRYQVARNVNAPQAVVDVLARDTNIQVLGTVAEHPNISQPLLMELAKNKNMVVRYAVTQNSKVSAETLALLSKDGELSVRSGVSVHPNTSAETLVFLAKDVNPDIRTQVAMNPNAPVVLLDELMKDENETVRAVAVKRSIPEDVEERRRLAGNENTYPEILTALAKDEDSEVRFNVAENPHTPAGILSDLAKDGRLIDVSYTDEDGREITEYRDVNFEIRLAAVSNPNIPSETLAFMVPTKDLGSRMYEDEFGQLVYEVMDESVDFYVAIADNPNTPAETLAKMSTDEFYVAIADGPNTPEETISKPVKDFIPIIRRQVARNPHTPAETLAILAKDENESVRQAAAENETFKNHVDMKTNEKSVTKTQESPAYMNIYASTRENRELSNFAIRPFRYNGVYFKSVEQAYQYHKGFAPGVDSESPEVKAIQQQILNTTNGRDLRILGNSFPGFEHGKWLEPSIAIMRSLIRESFAQNPEAAKRLLDTGSAILTHNQDRSHWQTDFPKILMEVRQELNNKESVVMGTEAVVNDVAVQKEQKSEELTFCSVEQAFQYAKTFYSSASEEVLEDYRKRILSTEDGVQLDKLGNEIPQLDKTTWDAVSSGLMADLVHEYNLQNPDAVEEAVNGNPVEAAVNEPVKDDVFSLKFTCSDGMYQKRTYENTNADDVDFTLQFAVDFSTYGELATSKAAGDSLISVELPVSDGKLQKTSKAIVGMAQQIINALPEDFINGEPFGVNVAGNGIYTLSKYGVTQESLDVLLSAVVMNLRDKGVNISSVRSGGQTGVDESAAVIGEILGVPTVIHGTKDYAFRGVDGKDVRNDRKAFVHRFEAKDVAAIKAKAEKIMLAKNVKKMIKGRSW